MARRPPNETPIEEPKPRARDAGHVTEAELHELALRFSDEIEYQNQVRDQQVERWKRFLTTYRAEPEVARKTYPWDNCSNLVIAICAEYVDSTAARIMGSLFATEPHWVGEQFNSAFASAVKPAERFMDFGARHVWMQKRAVKPFVLETIKLGTGVLFNGWRDEAWKRFDEKKGETVEAGRLYGPYPQWVPREDFLLPAGFTSIDNAPYVVRESWFSWHELKRLEANGYLENLDDVKEKPDDENDFRKFRREQQDILSEPATAMEYRLWRLSQIWFAEDLDGDGFPEEYVMLLHRATKTVLRFRPNPYVTGMRPFVAARFIEVEGEFDGIGIPQMVEHYQAEISTTHNQRRDNAHLRNTVSWITQRGSGITNREKWYPGKIWVVSNDPRTAVVPVQYSGNSVEATQEEQLTLGLAQQRVGLSDMNNGQLSSPMGRAAATTVLSLLQEGATRREFTTDEIRSALTEQGLQIMELYQTHGLPEAGDPHSPEVILAGDEEGAAKVRELFEQQDSIRGLVGLRINVATAAVNREIEKQSNMQLFQLVNGYMQQVLGLTPILANPQIPQQIKEAAVAGVRNMDTLMKRVFQSFGAYDLEGVLMGELIAPLAAPQPMPAAPMMPAGQPMAQADGNGAAAASPEQMMAAMMGGGGGQ